MTKKHHVAKQGKGNYKNRLNKRVARGFGRSSIMLTLEELHKRQMYGGTAYKREQEELEEDE